MKKILLISCLCLLSGLLNAQQPFITTWQVDSSDLDIGIPANAAAATYSYSVDFGDGTVVNNLADSITHTYAVPGVYTVTISGTFPKVDWTNVNGINRRQLLTIQQWGDIVWQDMQGAFAYCLNLRIPATDTPNLSMVTSMGGMFRGDTSLNDPIDHWDVSNITHMQFLFEEATAFNQPLNSWNVANVTSMEGMFKTAVSFNQPLHNWNVSKVTNMKNMFNDATTFNGDISTWNTAAVTNMENMFFAAKQFNQPINNWDVSNVTNVGALFALASAFNQPLNSWNVSKINIMASIFDGATAFNQPLNNWDVSNVTHFQGMFSGASSFNQPLNSWNIGNAIVMTSMFDKAASFDQNLSSWNFGSAVVLRSFVKNSGLSTLNYDTLLVRFDQLGISSVADFEANNLTYCNDSARQRLINKGWDITGDAKDANCITTTIDAVAAQSVKLYPNPVTDYIILQTHSGNLIEEIAISNLQGKVLRNMDQPGASVYVGDLPSGIYIVRLQTQAGTVMQKIIKQ